MEIILRSRASVSVFLSLAAILVIRCLLLAFPDLTDPTEGRYALSALDMIRESSYTIPSILQGDIKEPYLGKPPLFFWVTSVSFSVLGMSEWAARFPGFISYLGVVLILISFGSIVRDLRVGLDAALIWAGSLLPFFLSGTVSIDPLLTIFTSALLVISYKILQGGSPIKFVERCLLRVAFWILAGVSVLVKGPVILLYVATPIFLFGLFSRSLRHSLAALGVLYGPFIAAAVFMPWFVAAESANPGFVKYFLFSENLQRFLTKDYGDRYGTGHQHAYGFSLIFLFFGALPWSVAVLAGLRFPGIFSRIMNLKQKLKEDPVLLFSACWAFAAPFVLIFAQQLHPGYLLPAIPGSMIFLVRLLGNERLANLSRLLGKFLFPFLLLAFIISHLAIDLPETGAVKFVFVLSILAAATFVVYLKKKQVFGSLALSALTYSLVFMAIIIAAHDYVNENNSSKSILICILDNWPDKQEASVALIEVKQYSAYFYAESWQAEHKRSLKVDYIDSDELPRELQ